MFLDNNQLTGSIPTELGNLSSLEYLSLPNNQLTGSIPTELSNLSNLLWINLYGNQLTGCIPPALEDVPGGDLSHLGLPYCEDTEYAAQDSSEEPESPGSESVRRDLMAWADHDVIMLVWRAPHNMTVTGYQILRRLEGESEEQVLIADTATADTIYVDTHDIQPDTTYVYRVKAITESGVEEELGWIQVTTAPFP